MILVTKRDMDDAKALAERAGIEMDDFDAFLHDLAQAIADGRRADPLAWNDPANRYYEPVERVAEEIYNSYRYDGPGDKPAWTPHGNGIKQDEARRQARKFLERDGHVPAH